MNVLLQGHLGSLKLPEILTFLGSTRKKGALMIRNNPREASIYFDAGTVVFATSNQPMLRLGSILERQGALHKEDMERLEARMMRESAKFGHIVVSEGLITEEQLHAALKVQASEILYDCFSWTDGTFIVHEDMPLPEYAVTISLDLPNLIMEGARRIDEWSRCLELLPDPTMVFRVVGNPQTEEKITLTRAEWKLLFLINGERSLEELCNSTDVPRVEVYRVVYGLLGSKLIEPVKKPESAEEAIDFLPDPSRPITGSIPVVQGENTRSSRVAAAAVADDDRELLVSPDAKLSYRDVVKASVARLAVCGGAGENYSLTEQEYRIGRLRENEIQLFDLSVSGRHARIFRGPEGYMLEDLRSRNGTWVNGDRVGTILLRDGDVIRLGGTELAFELLA